MKKQITLYLLIIIGVSSLCVYIYLFTDTYNNITNSFKVSENKYDFLESSNSLMSNLRSAESYQRGYIITNNIAYFDLYNKVIYQLDIDKDRFAVISNSYGLIKSNPKEISTLSFLMTKKISEMNKIMALQNIGKHVEAVETIKLNTEKDIMSNIIEIFQKLNTEQKYKETQAKQSIYYNRANLRVIYLSIAIFNIIVLLLIGILIKKCLNKQLV